ncbi:MAB_1171c family putative transporter [Streptomyces sp. NBC_01508]|uniref:MAB_1171c family putative transporter n=1 Tax=Streptomyces sp. NBC_01508 TaxID=2903888 RepID=UPI003865EEF9
MNSLLYPLCSAVTLLALLCKIRALRAERSVTQAVLAANFSFLCALFTLSTPAVRTATSEFAGIVNLSELLTQGCVLAVTACQQLLLLHLTYGPAVARIKAIPRMLALGLVLITLSALFAESATPGEAPDELTHAPYPPAYLLVLLAALTVNQISIGVMGWRYSKIAPSLWLRRGLRVVACALPFVLVHTGARTADILTPRSGGTDHPWEPAAQLAVAMAVLVQTIGWILPDLGPHLTSTANRLRYRRIHRALTPLHRRITEQIPCPVIQITPPQNPRARLYRMVIEVRDAQWALRPWMDPEVARAAREEAERAHLKGDELAALVEAAQISGAIEAKRHNHVPEDPPETPLAAAPGDLAAELAFQQKLAQAMRSPILPRTTRYTVGGGAEFPSHTTTQAPPP